MAKEKAPPRSGEQRRADVLKRLAEDVDAWVSTSGEGGEPCLVPLSFVWHEGALVMATRRANPTAVNLARTGRAVIALGHTRDVILIDADGEVVPGTDLPDATAAAFADKLVWDPRDQADWTYLRFHPRTIRAWREQNELKDRELMHDGTWLT